MMAQVGPPMLCFGAAERVATQLVPRLKNAGIDCINIPTVMGGLGVHIAILNTAIEANTAATIYMEEFNFKFEHAKQNGPASDVFPNIAGVDCEFCTRTQIPVLLQICVALNFVFLFRLNAIHNYDVVTGYPSGTRLVPALVQFFQSREIIKTGVAVIEDIQKLKTTFRVQANNVVDTYRAALAINKATGQNFPLSLAGLLTYLVRGDFQLKGKKASGNTWTAPLTPKATKYAVNDAIASFEVFRAMIEHAKVLPKRLFLEFFTPINESTPEWIASLQEINRVQDLVIHDIRDKIYSNVAGTVTDNLETFLTVFDKLSLERKFALLQIVSGFESDFIRAGAVPIILIIASRNNPPITPAYVRFLALSTIYLYVPNGGETAMQAYIDGIFSRHQ
ncbi:ribonuclease H-like protein [Rhizoclosmatium globosum]|uniref:3'-5' exonuclease n=1 Tax=Rhizoclosmatium globosum TaxID=329046 RepID=A0A1Y2BUJ9_9FUNG|nr:ribonuclease H-like protein [Rhizoclosmatium globosum]|eukprot:ORY38426.1 ribonuclease H-like protein [Rhizoclosmatium globosum]